MKRRTLSMILCVCMVVSLVLSTGITARAGATDTLTIDPDTSYGSNGWSGMLSAISGAGTCDDPYAYTVTSRTGTLTVSSGKLLVGVLIKDASGAALDQTGNTAYETPGSDYTLQISDSIDSGWGEPDYSGGTYSLYGDIKEGVHTSYLRYDAAGGADYTYYKLTFRGAENSTYSDEGADYFWVGDGFERLTVENPTEDCGGSNPIVIKNTAELLYIAVRINDGLNLAYAYNGTTGTTSAAFAGYKLMANIDLDDAGWEPIGNRTHPFSGSFDGNGKIISGLRIDTNGDCVGLFGWASRAAIKNLSVSGNVSGGRGVSGVVGYAYQCDITNCYQSCDVFGRGDVRGDDYNTYTGGIVGYADSCWIVNCANTGNVTAENHWGVGGVAGCAEESMIANCYSAGSVSAEDDVGGVVGHSFCNEVSWCYYLKTGSINNGLPVLGYVEGGTQTGCGTFDAGQTITVDRGILSGLTSGTSTLKDALNAGQSLFTEVYPWVMGTSYPTFCAADALIPVTYTANYDDASESFVSYANGNAATILAGSTAFARIGHTLVGWTTTERGTTVDSGYTVGASQRISEPVTLYAVWDEDYVITYHSNFGSDTTETDYVSLGGAATLLGRDTFSREGYIIAGWDPDKNAETPTYDAWQQGVTVSSDTDLYAIWETNPYAASASSDHMAYSTDIDEDDCADTLMSFDIQGRLDGKNIYTTYASYGYGIWLQVGDSEKVSFNKIANGESACLDGVEVRQVLSLSSDGKIVSVAYQLKNHNTSAVTVKVGSSCDCQIDQNDAAALRLTATGFTMTQDDSEHSDTYGVRFLLDYVDTPFTTKWIGYYDDGPRFVFRNTTLGSPVGETLEDEDSGLAFSWTLNLSAGSTAERTAVFKVATAPFITGDTLGIAGEGDNMGKLAGSISYTEVQQATQTLYYSIDGAAYAVYGTDLSTTIGGYTNTFTDFVYDVSSLSQDQCHTCSFYVKDDQGNESNVSTYVFCIPSALGTDCTLTLFTSKGHSILPVNAEADAKVRLPQLTAVGSLLLGWDSDPDATVPTYAAGANYTISESATLYAIWTQAVYVTFDTNGGSAVTSPVAVAPGHAVAEPPAPARQGYDFGGWFTASNAKWNFSSAVTASMTLTAKWTEKQPGDSGYGDAQTAPNQAAPVIVDGVTYNIGTQTVDKGADTTTVTVDQNQLTNRIQNAAWGGSVVVPLMGETGTAAAKLMVKNVEDMAKKGIVLTVRNHGIDYELDTTAIDTASILAAVGATQSSQVTFEVSITKSGRATQAAVSSAVTQNGAVIVVQPVEFTVTATYGNRTHSVLTYSTFITRSIEITAEQASKITTAIVYRPDGTCYHVPTNVRKETDSKGVVRYYADIASLHESIYVLIHQEKSFSDADGRWYVDIVNEMASREIINGKDDGLFHGEDAITRAEFAAIVIRALGLESLTSTAANRFADVSRGAWYYNDVGLAYEYGIVSGTSETTFDPSRNITRQEAMLMIQRACGITGLAQGDKDCSSCTGLNEVSDWAMDSVLFNLKTGLIVGKDGGYIDAKGGITRAETATIVLRMMQMSGLFDVRVQA